MKKLILAVAACVAVWGMAEAIDLAGTDLAVSGLSENAAYTNSSDDLATLTVMLAANDTFEGTISGNIRLVVDGGSTQTLTKASSYTGGTYVKNACLSSTVGGTLGTGKVTVQGYAGAGNKVSQLRFDSIAKAGATFVNDIEFESASGAATSYGPDPDVGLNFYQPSGCITFTGKIVSNGTLYMHSRRSSSSTVFEKFTNEVTVNGALYCQGYNAYQFDEKITATSVSVEGSVSPTKSPIAYFKSSENVVPGAWIVRKKSKIYCLAADVFGGGYLRWNSNDPAMVNIGAYDQTVGCLAKEKNQVTTGGVTSDSYATLTVTGTTVTVKDVISGKAATTYATLNDELNFVMDAGEIGFAQTFTGSATTPKTHTIKGSLTVKGGTLAFAYATLPNLSALDLQGGTLTLDETAAGSLPATMDLALATGAVMDIPATTALTVRYFTYNGEYKDPQTLTHADVPEIPEGVTVTVTLKHSDVETVPIVWTGAADKTMANPLNWGLTGAALAFNEPKYQVTFAADGCENTEAEVTGPTVLDSLTFSDTTFALRKGDEAAALDIWEDGIALPETSAEPRTYLVEPPTVFRSEANLQIPAGDTLVFSNGISSAYELNVFGGGKLVFDGTSTFDGKVSVQCAQTTFRGLVATPGHVDQGDASDEKAARLVLHAGVTTSWPYVFSGVTIEKPVLLRSQSNTYNDLLKVSAGTTNVITGSAYCDNFSAEVLVDANAELRFEGGLSVHWQWRGLGSGTTVFAKKPFQHVYGTSVFQYSAGTTRFDVAKNYYRYGFRVNTGATVETTVSDALSINNYDSDTGDNYMNMVGGTLKLHATTQHVPRLCSSSASSTIIGDYPATIVVDRGVLEANVATKFVNCKVEGGVGFSMEGPDFLLLTNQTFASCGDLAVTNGVLELAADASWLNGTNFTAKGTGTLRFGAANQVDRRFARLHVADTGKVEIPADVTLKVASADVDGEPVAPGVYRKGDDGFGAYVEGEGAVQVGPSGVLLLVR